MKGDILMSKLENLNTKIEKARAEKLQKENRLKELEQQLKAVEKKERTHRLCKRMGTFESLMPDTTTLTDEQFHSFLEKAAERIIHSVNGEQKTISNKVDHRSFERQGIIDKLPTIHMGVAASQMEKKGIRTDKGNRNREIADINKEIRQTKARIRKLKDWLYTRPVENLPYYVGHCWRCCRCQKYRKSLAENP